MLHTQHVLDMLKKYGMTACKPIATPMEQNVKLRADVGDVLEDPTMYKKIFGSLIYATLTRPDMSHDVGVLSRFIQGPRKPHLDVACRVLHYAKSMLNYGLFYAHRVDIEVFGYTNANWARCAYDRRFTSGYVFNFGVGTVSWSSKKQPIVALSSTQAEYRGEAIVACEITWLRKLLHDLGHDVQGAVTLFCDNMSSIGQQSSFPCKDKTHRGALSLCV